MLTDVTIIMIKKLLKNIAWFFWPTKKQLKERELACKVEQQKKPQIGEITEIMVPPGKSVHIPTHNWVH